MFIQYTTSAAIAQDREPARMRPPVVTYLRSRRDASGIVELIYHLSGDLPEFEHHFYLAPSDLAAVRLYLSAQDREQRGG